MAVAMELVLASAMVAAESQTPQSYVLQFGVLGLVVVGLLWTKTVVPGWVLAGVEERLAQREAELVTLRVAIDQANAKALAGVTSALEATTAALAAQDRSR